MRGRNGNTPQPDRHAMDPIVLTGAQRADIKFITHLEDDSVFPTLTTEPLALKP